MMTGSEFPPPPSASPAGGAAVAASPGLPVAAGFPGRTLHSGPPVCQGCSQPILDQFILQVEGHVWHAACLRCHVCHASLNHVCYSGDSRLLCQDDFFRLFGATCTSCGEIIPPSALVRRARENIYHEDCFRCAVCRRELRTGDQFFVAQDGQLCCKEDFPTWKVKTENEDLNKTPSEQSPSGNSASLQSSGRISTAKDHENVLLKAFSENPNPGRVEVGAISTETGLSVAAVRRWFKRQRAKNKHRKGDDCEILAEQNGECRVHALTGGYPLPIVNKALSTDCPPETAAVNHRPSHAPCVTVWEELCSDDFVPPNVDLRPEQIKDGEVVMLQDGLGNQTGQSCGEQENVYPVQHTSTQTPQQQQRNNQQKDLLPLLPQGSNTNNPTTKYDMLTPYNVNVAPEINAGLEAGSLPAYKPRHIHPHPHHHHPQHQQQQQQQHHYQMQPHQQQFPQQNSISNQASYILEHSASQASSQQVLNPQHPHHHHPHHQHNHAAQQKLTAVVL